MTIEQEIIEEEIESTLMQWSKQGTISSSERAQFCYRICLRGYTMTLIEALLRYDYVLMPVLIEHWSVNQWEETRLWVRLFDSMTLSLDEFDCVPVPTVLVDKRLSPVILFHVQRGHFKPRILISVCYAYRSLLSWTEFAPHLAETWSKCTKMSADMIHEQCVYQWMLLRLLSPSSLSSDVIQKFNHGVMLRLSWMRVVPREAAQVVAEWMAAFELSKWTVKKDEEPPKSLDFELEEVGNVKVWRTWYRTIQSWLGENTTETLKTAEKETALPELPPDELDVLETPQGHFKHLSHISIFFTATTHNDTSSREYICQREQALQALLTLLPISSKSTLEAHGDLIVNRLLGLDLEEEAEDKTRWQAVQLAVVLRPDLFALKVLERAVDREHAGIVERRQCLIALYESLMRLEKGEFVSKEESTTIQNDIVPIGKVVRRSVALTRSAAKTKTLTLLHSVYLALCQGLLNCLICIIRDKFTHVLIAPTLLSLWTLVRVGQCAPLWMEGALCLKEACDIMENKEHVVGVQGFIESIRVWLQSRL